VIEFEVGDQDRDLGVSQHAEVLAAGDHDPDVF
jgi:hypothetical protein